MLSKTSVEPARPVIITCPNCQTRYKVANDQVTAAGRQVLCATCDTAWHATPSFPAPAAPPPLDPDPSTDELVFRADKDTIFTAADEAMLDDAFVKEERKAADPSVQGDEDSPPEPDAGPQTTSTPPAPRRTKREAGAADARTLAIAKRRDAMLSKLPLGRLRRAARIVIAGILLGLLIGAFTMRTDIVRAVPEFDALYRLVGLGTNTVGLEFSGVNTLRTTRDGNPVIIVTAKISNITNRVAYVPSVLVSLIDAEDRVIYEWTVAPATRNILPGDVLGIDTQLTAPPEGVERVRLSFVEGQNRTEASGTGKDR